jgi:glycosyltransferase involved in cell wall biosynthesis
MFRQSFVSVGMPVFNGEKYLRQTIEAILAQTYKNFELIISDNASTDKTRQICFEYTKRDDRIIYHRNEKNLGAARNYNITFNLSSGVYFKWAAHDDILDPEYLKKCVAVLDKNESILCCHSKVGRINENGILVGSYDERTLDNISSFKPHKRFADMLSQRNACWTIFGVIRASALKKTPLLGNYIGSDRNLLAELALMGRTYEIPERLMLRRDHPKAFTHVYYSRSGVRDYRKLISWFTTEKRRIPIVLPNWKNCFEYFRSVNRVPLELHEKYLCYQEIGRWLIRDKGYRFLKWDITNELEFWRLKLYYGKKELSASNTD